MTSFDPGFVHLKVHSAYSLLEGALAISRLAELAVKDDMPALGLMDRNNLFGALEFSESLTKARIQPIVGISLDVVFANENEDISVYDVAGQNEREQVAGCLSILAKDEVGYKNLMALASAGYLTSNDHSGPCIRFEDLQNHAEGLIALTGGREGPLDVALRDGKSEQAQTYLTQLLSIFSGNLYVEIQRMGHPEDKQVEAGLLGLAYARDIPLVATNEVYFAESEDFEAHDALICISDGRYVAEDDRRRLTPEYRFKSRSEMMQLFADLPEALANTVEISKRSAFRPRTRAPILPQFVANNLSSEDNVVAAEAEELRKQAEEGLELRLEHHGMAPGISRADYRKRLAFELDVITRMKFPGYFLIVADFIKGSKAEGIPVGPGRGSGAGSLVAWSLTITDLDPLRFDLLFERFLNPERVSMPDFDIDFCQERRDEVIRYVQDKYGEDRVAQIITYGKLQARAVLRDVGRVLQMPYGQVDRLCKLVPNNPANPVTLEQAIEDEPRIREARESEPIVERLLNIGLKLEGLYRHASTHAAGVVIGDRKLTELVPLYQDSRSALPATQFNMKWVEAAGLVKFDFLGLKTLSVIEKTIQLIADRGEKIDPSLLPLDDRATYELMARGDTIGVFQLEGSGMRESLRKLKPDRFEDIIAMVALYRPGPMDNIETYINRKYEREEVDYLHPLIEPILKETYGVIIYQEQVMQVAQQLSGYSLGEADLLRRAMGKKIKSEMDSQKSRFIEGAMENSVDKSRAAFIFELVEKFAGYGFNKSHAAAYALLAYHTAYLKANYPVEFISASMTFDMGNTDKLNIFSQDARQLGIDILPPSINYSVVEFKPEGKAIRYSLAALKNVGRQSVVSLCREREANGHFESLLDFAERVNPKDINKRALENLAASGAFDDLSPNRAEVYDNVDVILATANKTNDDRTSGQNDLFGGGQQKLELTLKKRDKWLPMDQLGYEFDAVGFFLTGHPLDQYQTVISRLDCMTWIEIEEEARIEHTGGLIAATVVYKQERKSKSGNQFAFAAFSDQTGQFEAVVFSDTLNSSRELLEPGTAVLLRVDAEFEGESLKTRVISVESLDHAAERIQQTLQIVIDRPESLEQIKARVLQPGNGQLQLVAYLDDLDREVQITLPGKFDVSPRQAGLARTLSDILDVREC
ncbi:MAG: DNA polymerase III subunit alpha [Methyloligellaceae bacterium]